MLVQFSVVPLGTGESISGQVARILDLVDGSGLSYRLTAMGTIVEGEWDVVMTLIRRCHEEALRGAPRALTTVIIDDRPGKTDRITEKIRSVETKLGRELRR